MEDIQSVPQLKCLLVESQQRNNQYSQQIFELSSLLTDLQSKHQELNLTYQNTCFNLERANQEVEDLKSSLESRDKLLAEVNQETFKERVELKAEIADLKNQVSQLKSSEQRFFYKSQDLEAQTEKLQSTRSKCLEELQTLQKESTVYQMKSQELNQKNQLLYEELQEAKKTITQENQNWELKLKKLKATHQQELQELKKRSLAGFKHPQNAEEQELSYMHKLRDSQKNCLDLQGRVGELEKLLNDKINQYETLIPKFEDQEKNYRKLVFAYNSLKTSFQEKSRDNLTLNKELSKTKEQLKKLQERTQEYQMKHTRQNELIKSLLEKYPDIPITPQYQSYFWNLDELFENNLKLLYDLDYSKEQAQKSLNAKEKEIQDLTEQNQSLQNQLVKAFSSNFNFEELNKSAELQTKYKEALCDIETLKAQNQSLTEECNLYRNHPQPPESTLQELDLLQSQISQKDLETHQVQIQLQTSQIQAESTLETLQNLRFEHENLKHTHESLSSTNSALQQEIEKLYAEYDSLKQELLNTQTQVEHLTQEKLNYFSKYKKAQFKHQKAIEESQDRTLIAEYNQLKEKHKQLKHKVSMFEQESSDKDYQIIELKNQLDQLTPELTQKLQAINQGFDKLNNEYLQTIQKNQHLKNQASDKDYQIGELKNQLDQLTPELTQKLRAINQGFDKLNNEYLQTIQKNQDLENQITELKNKQQETLQLCNQLETKEKHNSAELKKLTQENENLQANIEKLSESLKKLLAVSHKLSST